LGLLESQFEAEQAGKRLVVLSLCGLLSLTVFILFQIGMVDGMVHLGLPLWASCFIVGILFAGMVAALWMNAGRRDARRENLFRAAARSGEGVGVGYKNAFLRREELQRRMSAIRGSWEPPKKSHPILSLLGSSLPTLAFFAAKKWTFAQPVSFLSRFFT